MLKLLVYLPISYGVASAISSRSFVKSKVSALLLTLCWATILVVVDLIAMQALFGSAARPSGVILGVVAAAFYFFIKPTTAVPISTSVSIEADEREAARLAGIGVENGFFVVYGTDGMTPFQFSRLDQAIAFKSEQN